MLSHVHTSWEVDYKPADGTERRRQGSAIGSGNSEERMSSQQLLSKPCLFSPKRSSLEGTLKQVRDGNTVRGTYD